MANEKDIQRFQFLCSEIATRISESASVIDGVPNFGDVDNLIRELAKCSKSIRIPSPISIDIKRTDTHNECHIALTHVGDACQSESGILWLSDRRTGEIDSSEFERWCSDAVLCLERWNRYVGGPIFEVSESQQNVNNKSTNDDRDKWIYEQCCNGVAYDTIARSLKSQANDWAIISSKQGIYAAAKRYAERHRLSPIPKRQQL